MAKKRTRTVRLYAMHARADGKLLDYSKFFENLSQLNATDSIVELTQELTMAVDASSLVESTFSARIILGKPGDVPLYFDYRTGNTESGVTPEGKWLAQVSRIVVDSSQTRLVALESNNAGVSATRLSRYFEKIAIDKSWATRINFELTPVPSQSLLDDIDSLVRIREAAAVVSRPNFDWSDFGDDLSQLASESGGQEAQASVKAARGESLKKDEGIVETIKNSLQAVTPHVKSFKIWGKKQGSEKEEIISSEMHQERRHVTIPPDSDPSTMDNLIISSATALIDETRSRMDDQVANDG